MLLWLHLNVLVMLLCRLQLFHLFRQWIYIAKLNYNEYLQSRFVYLVNLLSLVFLVICLFIIFFETWNFACIFHIKTSVQPIFNNSQIYIPPSKQAHIYIYIAKWLLILSHLPEDKLYLLLCNIYGLDEIRAFRRFI